MKRGVAGADCSG